MIKEEACAPLAAQAAANSKLFLYIKELES